VFELLLNSITSESSVFVVDISIFVTLISSSVVIVIPSVSSLIFSIDTLAISTLSSVARIIDSSSFVDSVLCISDVLYFNVDIELSTFCFKFNKDKSVYSLLTY